MKKLTLLRHARTVDFLNSETDKQRALTEKGLEDALALGKKWASESQRFDKIYSSSAVRAQMTVSVIAEKIEYAASEITLLDELYSASEEFLYHFIQAIPNSYDTVLIVNHNPTLTSLCYRLLDDYIPLLYPCTAIELRFEVESWQHIGRGSATLLRRLEPDISEY
ncbi:SixA phosphatase family protein [Hugenholtzia roseola]|uniref:SixA phosphatase family protein n=1 Tax=Hugenholtzia roseola TaxID=1002 RepID=UPI0003F8FEA1|nr:histidine phosphatase family protein [Hugenholtzia roseola]